MTVAVFVLGDARSGTSTLAQVLSLCGGALASAPVGNGADSSRKRAANVINEKILRRNGSDGFDPTLRLQDDGAFDAEEKAACIAEIQAFLNALPPAPFVVVKDPRIPLVCGLWFEAARLSGFDVATVIAVRHPSEVIASVVVQSPVMPELSSALWLKVNLLAEAETRDVPRVFVDHANLVEDWSREVDRMSAALGIDLDVRDEAAIERLVRPKLRLEQRGAPMAELAAAEEISVVYDVMSAAARDEPVDHAELDRAFAAYRARERGFRPLIDGFQRLDKMSKHFRPSVMKMIDKARETAANRRRAT